ncbi:MAG TPA: NAD(+) kinase [Thiotrichaceae bacterium]|jgi:NAD+ kinase|nr:NAD(+) kinase [Thiotrichaceae bacterium]HIM08412.1 NAD(+) kinase [Gammaproteobacteria bacterium]
MFKRIGLITNSGVKAIHTTLSEVVEYLSSREKEVILDKCCSDLLGEHNFNVYDANELGKHCDLVIAIGGDGTMLMATHILCDFDVPLLGINLGHVGFLSDIPADDIAHSMDEILNGHYVEDVRFLLWGEVFREGKRVYEGYALNDIVIQKWNIARLVELETYINGVFVHTHRSDGMIVSSPTGSTAYALAGGGPVVHPSLDALLLVPICPYSLTNRPIVVDGNSSVEIVVSTREVDHARLTFDGEIKLELAPNDRIRVKKKDKEIRLIHPPDHDQFHILREKLHWSK